MITIRNALLEDAKCILKIYDYNSRKCECKFNRWYNIIWMEEILENNRDIQNPIKINRL